MVGPLWGGRRPGVAELRGTGRPGVGPDGKAVAAINVRCLEGVDLDALEVTHYDGRNA
jgi:hypothetical protein